MSLAHSWCKSILKPVGTYIILISWSTVTDQSNHFGFEPQTEGRIRKNEFENNKCTQRREEKLGTCHKSLLYWLLHLTRCLHFLYHFKCLPCSQCWLDYLQTDWLIMYTTPTWVHDYYFQGVEVINLLTVYIQIHKVRWYLYNVHWWPWLHRLWCSTEINHTKFNNEPTKWYFIT